MSSLSENDFRKKFLRLVKESGLKVQKEWETPFPDFVPVVAKFVDADLGRILTVEESSDFEFATDYAIRKTGLNFDQYDLLLRFQDTSSNMGRILDIYDKWFIEVLSLQEMEKYISGEKDN